MNTKTLERPAKMSNDPDTTRRVSGNSELYSCQRSRQQRESAALSCTRSHKNPAQLNRMLLRNGGFLGGRWGKKRKLKRIGYNTAHLPFGNSIQWGIIPTTAFKLVWNSMSPTAL